MALYFFDVDDDGEIYIDNQGTPCRDRSHVKAEATRALAEMMVDSPFDIEHHKMTIAVRDEADILVLQIALTFDVEAEHRGS